MYFGSWELGVFDSKELFRELAYLKKGISDVHYLDMHVF